MNAHAFAARFGPRPEWRRERDLEEAATEARRTVSEIVEILRDAGYKFAERRGDGETFYRLAHSPFTFGGFSIDDEEREREPPPAFR
jgi:hypothetical protein